MCLKDRSLERVTHIGEGWERGDVSGRHEVRWWHMMCLLWTFVFSGANMAFLPAELSLWLMYEKNHSEKVGHDGKWKKKRKQNER